MTLDRSDVALDDGETNKKDKKQRKKQTNKNKNKNPRILRSDIRKSHREALIVGQEMGVSE
jgi:hypothetical protein